MTRPAASRRLIRWMGRLRRLEWLLPAWLAGAGILLATAIVMDHARSGRHQAEATALSVEIGHCLEKAQRALRSGEWPPARDWVDEAAIRLERLERLRGVSAETTAKWGASFYSLRGQIHLAGWNASRPTPEPHPEPNPEPNPDALIAALNDFALAETYAARHRAGMEWLSAAWFGQAEAHVGLGEWEMAATLLDKLLRRRPVDAEGLRLRARVRQHLGDSQGAGEDRRRAAELGYAPFSAARDASHR